jgi:hypothetical protein
VEHGRDRLARATVQDMPPVLSVPLPLRVRPFSSAEAYTRGVSATALRSPQYRRLFHGVYACSALPLDCATWVRAAHLVVPGDATLTSLSGLHLRGIAVGPACPLRFVTTARHQVRRAGLSVSRLAALPPHDDHLASPPACWVAACASLDLVDAVTAADQLLHRRSTTLPALHAYVGQHHGPGIGQARRALRLVRERVESPRESVVRLALVLAGLPEPDCNVAIRAGGAFLARADLAYVAARLLVEYDGRQHAEDVWQWNRDLDRHDALTAAGWACVRLTAARLQRPREAVSTVHRSLVAAGCSVAAPVFGPQWTALFETTSVAGRGRANDHRRAWEGFDLRANGSAAGAS